MPSTAIAQSGDTPAQIVQGDMGMARAPTSLTRPQANFEYDYESKVRMALAKNPAQFYNSVKQVASCVARKDKAAGRLIGGYMTDDVRYSRLVSALGGRQKTCLSVEAAGAPMPLVNGALAEVLLVSEKPKLVDRPGDFSTTSAKSFYMGDGGQSLESLSRCLAVHSSGLAYRVLQSRFGSREESNAISDLYKGSPECGIAASPSGMNPATQRAALATALYLWIHRKG